MTDMSSTAASNDQLRKACFRRSCLTERKLRRASVSTLDRPSSPNAVRNYSLDAETSEWKSTRWRMCRIKGLSLDRRRSVRLRWHSSEERWTRRIPTRQSSLPQLHTSHLSVTSSLPGQERGIEGNGTSSQTDTERFSTPNKCATQNAFCDNGKIEEDRLEFLKSLAALKKGSLFAGRYEVETEDVYGKLHCRYAIDKTTGESVFLKFFPRDSPEFLKTVDMHRQLQPGQRYICRIIEAIRDAEGLTPCLVLERCSHTLSDRMAGRSMSFTEQLAILYSVLEALNYLHTQGITHGNLTPSNIVWSTTEFSWKLTALEYASKDGEVIHPHRLGRYTSPEIIQSKRQEKDPMALCPSADMWSYGIIAFEVLTGACVTDPGAIREYIDRRLSLPTVTIDRSLQKWPSSDPKDNIQRATENQNLRFILALLQENPEERNTAMQSMQDALFRSASIVRQNTNLQQTETDPMARPDLASARELISIVVLNNHLDFLVDLEYLPEDTPSDLPLHLRTGERAWAFRDEYLLNHPVYFFKLGTTCRLRIRITPTDGSGMTVRKIVSVVAKAPDGDCIPLTIEQHYKDDAAVALALFGSTQLNSQKLQRKSPQMGMIEEKYVNIQLFVKIVVGGSIERELDLFQNIYCQVIDPKKKLRLQKLLKMVMNKGIVRRPFELD